MGTGTGKNKANQFCISIWLRGWLKYIVRHIEYKYYGIVLYLKIYENQFCGKSMIEN